MSGVFTARPNPAFPTLHKSVKNDTATECALILMKVSTALKRAER